MSQPSNAVDEAVNGAEAAATSLVDAIKKMEDAGLASAVALLNNAKGLVDKAAGHAKAAASGAVKGS